MELELDVSKFDVGKNMEETIYVKACFGHVSTIFSMYNFQSILNRNHKREPLL